MEHPVWGAYAHRLLTPEERLWRNPSNGGHDDKAHPPIHPTKFSRGESNWSPDHNVCSATEQLRDSLAERSNSFLSVLYRGYYTSLIKFCISFFLVSRNYMSSLFAISLHVALNQLLELKQLLKLT